MRKINWGVLGTANIAKSQVIPGMQMAKNCHLYAIAGRKVDKVQQFQDLFEFEKSYYSYDALLNDTKVEAVYIPLSNELHKEWLIKAARKKKHILCEKPLVATAKEVEEVIEICQQEGVIFMEAFAYLHSPIVNDLLDRVQSGIIGDIRMIEAAFYISKRLEGDIRSYRHTLGGAQFDVGCYPISFITKLMNQMPEKVEALGRFTKEGVDDYTHAILTYSNDVIALASCGMMMSDCVEGRIDRLFIQGTTGQIDAPIPYNGTGELSYHIMKEGKTETVTIDVPNNYLLEIEQFGNCVLGLEQPAVSNVFSHQVARIQDEILDQIGYWKKT